MKTQENSVIIKLEEMNSNPVFIGKKSRMSSATSVVFLDENTIACAHFSAEKIYIYRFDLDKNIYEKISELDTTYNGIKCKTDLMTHDGQSLIRN